MKWFIGCLRRYADFNGRAGRAEYWNFFLVYIVVAAVLGIIDAQFNITLLAYIWSVALFVPYIAVGARRLHDIGFSGLFLLIALVPFGVIAVLIMLALPTKAEPNKYGNAPRVLAEA